MNFFSKIYRKKNIYSHKEIWFLIFVSTLFILLRSPSLVEPHWYGDEGIYQVVGRAVVRGEILYKDIWDNKPPLLYIIYAIFDGTLFSVKLASLIAGLLSIFSFYFLAAKVFKNLLVKFSVILIFAILFALPLIEGNIANAENFMLFPITLSGYFIFKYKESKKIFDLIFAGFLLSVAFTIKVVAFFDFLAFFAFLLISLWEEHGIRMIRFKYLKNYIAFFLSFISLLILSLIYFSSIGVFGDFISGVYAQNINYVNVENSFIIPNGILFLKTLLLLSVLVLIFKKRKVLISKEIFIYLWLAFSIYNSLFSQRPYIHYILVILPVFSLLAGLIIESIATKSGLKKRLNLNLFIFFGLILISVFHFTVYDKTFEYYLNYLKFITNKKTAVEYEAFFDQQTPRDYEIANFINVNVGDNEQVFLWSDNAQIYALSNKLPIGKYIVAYHITFYNNAKAETRKAINIKKPKFIIQTTKVPFPEGILSNYSLRYIVSGVKIYEREL